MGAFDQQHRCTLGSADFQLSDYEVSEETRTRPGVGLVGMEFRVEGSGWMEAATAALFAAKLGTTADAFRVSGENFQIFGLGGEKEYELLAAQVSDGGPHVDFTILSQSDGAGLVKEFRFTVKARTGTEFSGGPTPGYEDRITTGADDLRTVTRSGSIEQSNAVAHFTGTLMPAFLSLYPKPTWLHDFEYSVDQQGRKLTYRLTARETIQPLPAHGNGSVVVDGEATLRKRRDEQMRLLLVYEFDLVLKGIDHQAVLDQIRPQGVVILRESVDVTLHQEVRLHATFEVLTAASGTLMDWQQSFELMPAGAIWREQTFPGAAPLLIQEPAGFQRVVQSGRAVGAGAFPSPPGAIFPGLLVERPRVTHTDLDVANKETRWLYVMAPQIAIASGDVIGVIGRPES